MKQNYSVQDYFNPSLKYIDNNLALGTVLCSEGNKLEITWYENIE